MTTQSLSLMAGPDLPVIDANDDTQQLFYKTISDAAGDAGLYTVSAAGEWVRQGVRILSRQGREQVVAASTAESTLFSFTVPGGALGLNGAIHIIALGGYLNNGGANQTIRTRVKFGGVTIFEDLSPTAASNANERGFRIDLYLSNDGSVSLNQLNGDIDIGGTGAAIVGSGDLGSDEILSTAIVSTPNQSTVDTSVDQVLEITVQLSTATSGSSVRRDLALAEIR